MELARDSYNFRCFATRYAEKRRIATAWRGNASGFAQKVVEVVKASGNPLLAKRMRRGGRGIK